MHQCYWQPELLDLREPPVTLRLQVSERWASCQETELDVSGLSNNSLKSCKNNAQPPMLLLYERLACSARSPRKVLASRCQEGGTWDSARIGRPAKNFVVVPLEMSGIELGSSLPAKVLQASSALGNSHRTRSRKAHENRLDDHSSLQQVGHPASCQVDWHTGRLMLYQISCGR